MIEKDLETCAVAAFNAALPGTVQTMGFWQSVAEGAVKDTESASAAAVLRVETSPRSHENFTTPRADVAFALTLTVRKEVCPTGAELAEFAEPLFAVLTAWQMDIADVRRDFTISDFVPVGFRLDGGDVINDVTAKTWVVRESFTVRGIVKKGTAS